MRSICAWCNKPLENDDGDFDENTPITHGICQDCMKLFEFQEVPIQEFLDRLNKVILLANKDSIIEDANDEAVIKLKKPKKFMQNFPLGNVSQCFYSELPEGCGHTIHCSGCAIRSAVTKTYETNKPIKNLETFQYQRSDTGVKKVKMAISTEKIGKKVLLQIENIS